MSKPEKGLYVAKVTDEGTTKMHADEEAVCDYQTDKLFKDRDQNRVAQNRKNAQQQAEAEKARIQKEEEKAKLFWVRQTRKRRIRMGILLGVVTAALVACVVFGLMHHILGMVFAAGAAGAIGYHMK